MLPVVAISAKHKKRMNNPNNRKPAGSPLPVFAKKVKIEVSILLFSLYIFPPRYATIGIANLIFFFEVIVCYPI